MPADDLWKGVTSVSNAGRKRGRGKGLMRRKDLNRGQVIGIGKANIQWPGLSAPIIRGRELVQQQQLPEDTERCFLTIINCQMISDDNFLILGTQNCVS